MIEWENHLSEYEKKSVAAVFIPQLKDLENRSPLASELLKILSFFDAEKISVNMLVSGAQAISNPRTLSNVPSSTAPLSHEAASSSISKVRNAISRRFSWTQRHDAKEIPEDFQPNLSPLAYLIQSAADLRESLSLLQDLSLTEHRGSRQDPSLRLHELSQLMVQEHLRRVGNEKEPFQFAVRLCCAAFEKVGDLTSRTNWSDCEAFIPHIQSLTARSEAFGFIHPLLLCANERVAQYFHCSGRYADAQSLLRRLMRQSEVLHGPTHSHTLRLMEGLARTYGSRGRHGEAETLFRRVLEIREARYGREHDETLRTLNNMGDGHLARRMYKEAEGVFRRVLATWEKRVGVTHPYTRTAMNNLATALHHQAKNTEAEALYRRVLAIEEAELGEEHFDTLTSMNNLANLHVSQKRFTEAEDMHRRVFRARRKHQGADHPETLLAAIGLGYAVQLQRRYSEAEKLYKRVLEAGSKRLGPRHPHMLKAMRYLVKLYQAQKRVDEARLISQHIARLSSNQDG